jgi:hypothetical protein
MGDGTAPSNLPPGIDPSQQQQFIIFDIVLTSGQEKLGQVKAVEKIGDFLLTAIYGSSTGLYELSIKHPNNGRPFCTSYIRSDNFVGSAKFPLPIKPTVFPGGSTISVDFHDLSAAGNTIQLVLKGINLLKV